MRCEKCYSKLAHGSMFCPHCAEMEKMVQSSDPAPIVVTPSAFCPNCGIQQVQGVKFCQNCGHAMQGVPPSTVMYAATPASSRRKSRIGVVVGLLMLITVTAIGVWTLVGDTSVPSNPKSGKVEFGLELTPESDGVITPRTSFKDNDSFAYVGHLNRSVNATTMDILLVFTDGESEQVVDRREINISDPKFNQVSNRIMITTIMVGQPSGRYKLKFIQAAEILAEGEFRYTR